MPKFTKSLHGWKSASFTQTLKNEIQNLKTGALPLDKGAFQGGHIDDSNLAITVLHVTDDEKTIQARVGIFRTGQKLTASPACSLAYLPSAANNSVPSRVSCQAPSRQIK